MHKPNTWTARETLLGWTADHRVAYRSLVCDPSYGSGRSSYCDLLQCVTVPARPVDDCTVLASEDLNDDAADRAKIDTADAIQKSKEHLASLGALDAGQALATSSIRTSLANRALTITSKAGSVVVDKLMSLAEAEERGERPNSFSAPKIGAASASRDGVCVAVVGHYTFEGYYEALATATPTPFARVICRKTP
jgi:hypothetical protein